MKLSGSLPIPVLLAGLFLQLPQPSSQEPGARAWQPSQQQTQTQGEPRNIQQQQLGGQLGDILKRHLPGSPTGQPLAVSTVFFGTDRQIVQAPITAPPTPLPPSGPIASPGDSPTPVQALNLPDPNGATTLGICRAALESQPARRSVRQIGAPASSANQFNYPIHPDRDADRNYAVQSIVPLTPEAFWKQANLTGPRDALLFIHGYRVSFNDACRRAAQIAADLKFAGPVFLWSWPSRDTIEGYFQDEKAAAASSPRFLAFLRDLLARPGLNRLHVVAHSMGTRLLEQALISPQLTQPELAHLGQVVFAAPDLSRTAFDEDCDPARIPALRITLYASKHDEALRTARLTHPFPRLGDANPTIDIRPGMDSIDASEVDTSLLGHSYIGNSRGVLADVAALISTNAEPSRRPGMKKMGTALRQWWTLNP